MIRRWGHCRVFDMVELAVIGEGFSLPRFQNNLQSFLESLPAFLVGDPHDFVSPHVAAASHAELESAFADLVHGRRFFGDPQGIDQGQDLYRHADFEPLGSRRDRTGHDDGRRKYRAVGVKMRLPQPHRVQARFFGQVHQFECLPEHLVLSESRGTVEVHEHSEFHLFLTALSGILRPSHSTATTGGGF